MKPPAFQFYPKDYLEFKVLRMSDAAQGIYMRLLCHIWIGTETQYSIPNNDKTLAKILSISFSKWIRNKKEIQQILDPLFIEEGGMLVSKRLREEAEKQAHRREQTSQAAHKKWDKERMQTHMQTECPTSSSAKDIHISSLPKQLKKEKSKIDTTPFKSLMLPAFTKEWSKTHEGVYPVNWGGDAAAAKYIWGLCLVADPANPAKYYEDHMKTIMATYPVDNFVALRSFWAFSLRKKPKRGLADV